MRLLIVSADPRSQGPTQTVLKAALDYFEQAFHQTKHLDLYKMGFNPVSSLYALGQSRKTIESDLKAHMEAIEWASGLVFVYPLWQWERPAILKGWFDRLFFDAIKLSPQGRGHEPRLGNKRSLVFQTSEESEARAQEEFAEEVMKGGIGAGTLELCGIQLDHIQTYYRRQVEDDFLQRRTVEICKKWDSL